MIDVFACVKRCGGLRSIEKVLVGRMAGIDVRTFAYLTCLHEKVV